MAWKTYPVQERDTEGGSGCDAVPVPGNGRWEADIQIHGEMEHIMALAGAWADATTTDKSS